MTLTKFVKDDFVDSTDPTHSEIYIQIPARYMDSEKQNQLRILNRTICRL